MAKARPVKGINCKTSVASNARKIIDVRLDELLSWSPYVDDPRFVEELHNLRIAAKRLRYTLELFRFAFPNDLVSLIDEVKEIQEHIGNMHDADVMIERMQETIGTDSVNRRVRLTEIAMAVERGTTAQRHQRIRSAMSSRTTPRDELAFYTLIAFRADDRADAYQRFVFAWKRMEESEFPNRLRRLVGLILETPLEDGPADTVSVADPVSEAADSVEVAEPVTEAVAAS